MANSITFFSFFIFSSLALLTTPATCSVSNNRTDLLSLLALKKAINVDPHGALNSWNETTHFCSWNGIRCGGRHPNRVVAINLSSHGLIGSLTPHIGNLSFLRSIFLQNNYFYGKIPQQISLLRRLEIVEFSNNSFVGEIPKNLSQCPNLFHLKLINNNLSGPIPNELGSMYKLQNLGLAGNKISGHIPPFIGNMTSLNVLSLTFCGFKGEIPESLAQLGSLIFLNLGGNNLTGTIPSGLFNVSTLEYFLVYSNQLHGVIPSTIGLTLPNLMVLAIWENQFTGPIPASISNASFLAEIDVGQNHFTGPMPRFGSLTRLAFFSCVVNLIEDDISFISSLTNSTELQVIQVGQNLFHGSLPDSIANLSTQLYNFNIIRNKIHGTVPSGIENLIGLTSLAITSNYLESPIPVGISKLSNLQEFFAGGNSFTNELPSSFGNLTLLNRLYLGVNSFSGNVPSSLGNCTNLLLLDLSYNNFSGLIPPEIMSLSSISITLHLSHNAFEGSIPHEVGSLTNLAKLYLSNNRLSGVIPSSLSNCKSLLQLHLDGNLLEGEIPIGMSALMGLQDLDLSRNNLSGAIPSFLGKLQLDRLNLSFNRLEGEVPISGVFKNKTSISLDGNKELCGGIAELNLPPCSSTNSHKKNVSTRLKILIPVLVAAGICLMLSLCLIYKKQRQSRKSTTSSVSSFIGEQFLRLSYGDLMKATDGFSEMNLLGVGRFGSVYKGILDGGKTIVAVKVLNLFVRGASKSFLAECNALKDIRHRNLLKLLSICESVDFQGNDFKALIYEFKANGSLEKWLRRSTEQEGEGNAEIRSLNLMQRLKIAIDIAHALEYLHFGTNSAIVHGDLKPSNILLDHDLTAYVGDFGLAKIISSILPSHESSSSIGIKGTFGYVAPEYAMSDLVSPQGDVYSYGILLLEMFTNKGPTDEAFKDQINLHSFVSDALPDSVMEIVDPLIASGHDVMNSKVKDCMTSVLSIGIACSRTMPRDRMLIKDVARELGKISDSYQNHMN